MGAEAARSAVLERELEGLQARLAEQMGGSQQGEGIAGAKEAQELRRQLNMASSRLAQLEAAQETAAQRAQAAEQRERELGAQLAAAQSEMSNSDEWSGAKGEQLKAAIAAIAEELRAESRRAAGLQERFDRLQRAAVESAKALRSFELRLTEQNAAMEVLRSALADASTRLAQHREDSSSLMNAKLTAAVGAAKQEWEARLLEAANDAELLRLSLADASEELEKERARSDELVGQRLASALDSAKHKWEAKLSSAEEELQGKLESAVWELQHEHVRQSARRAGEEGVRIREAVGEDGDYLDEDGWVGGLDCPII